MALERKNLYLDIEVYNERNKELKSLNDKSKRRKNQKHVSISMVVSHLLDNDSLIDDVWELLAKK